MMKIYKLACGLEINEMEMSELFKICEKKLESNESVFICTINPEIVELYIRLPLYKKVIQTADIKLIDGIGISLAILRQYKKFPKRLTGVKLSWELVKWATLKNRASIIIGASNKSRLKAEQVLRERGYFVMDGGSPKVNFWGEVEDKNFSLDLPQKGVVLVALGAPKQEFFIHKLITKKSTSPNVFIGVGGAIDYISGIVTPPPSLIKNAGLEWFYRLVSQPKKRLKRQINSLPSFLWNEIILRKRR